MSKKYKWIVQTTYSATGWFDSDVDDGMRGHEHQFDTEWEAREFVHLYSLANVMVDRSSPLPHCDEYFNEIYMRSPEQQRATSQLLRDILTKKPGTRDR